VKSLKFACSGFLTFVALSGATGQQPATVSRELAEAFVRGYASPAPDSVEKVAFVEGQIPANLQSVAHMPAGTRLLGTVVLSRSSHVIAISSLSPDSALKAIAGEYGRAGWPALSALRSNQTANPMLGGFRQPLPTTPTHFCNDTTDVDAYAARVPTGDTEIRLRVTKSVIPCPNSRLASGTRRVIRPTTRLPLPQLIDPPASTPTSECYVYGASQGTSTLLSTTLAPSALLEHYGRQMESQGWKVATPDDAGVRRVWTRTDSAGVTETATMVINVTPITSGCRNATLQVTTLRNP